MSAPPCDSECGARLRSKFAEHFIEVTVSHLPPLVCTGYELLGMRCPHGVPWYAEPTSEQIAEWRRLGVP